MHASPANDYVDHGFYSFSPTVFYDYYTANGFQILKSCIFEVLPSINTCIVYDYDPKKFSLPRNGFGELLVWFVARKVDESTCDVIPQQGAYVKTWSEFSEPSEVKFSPSPGLISHLKQFTRKNKLLLSLTLPIARLIGIAKKEKPPIIAKYDYT